MIDGNLISHINKGMHNYVTMMLYVTRQTYNKILSNNETSTSICNVIQAGEVVHVLGFFVERVCFM